MTRVLYIHHGGGIGGAPLSLLYLLRQLDRSRYEPVVVTLKPGPVVDMFRAEGIETHVETGISDFSHTNLEWYGGRDVWRLPGKLLRILPSIRRARAVIRRIQPGLIHLNSSTLVLPAIAAAREGVPFVWHIREPLHPGYLGLRRAWIRRVLHRHAARVVAISQHDADQLLPGKHVRVIYNFVHFEQFDRSLSGEGIRAELGIPPDAPVVTMLGGVAAPKGTLTLVRALPDLVQAVPGVRVIVAGPPPRPLDEPGIKRLAKRLLRVDAYQKATQAAVAALAPDVREALIFTGIRRDVPALLAATDCLVFPSSVAHFARPIIEAAAMGVPAVASDLGGPRELVVEGETGLLVPHGDPAALAEALAALLADPARAAAMGEAAYQRARR
ncbi:MAG TPA: glycosyltransferase family 4 protein, partial [Aggregatilineales bacterium]|nr:glycosyltransferase family 4 protein [Aggregatilineales bacterium]